MSHAVRTAANGVFVGRARELELLAEALNPENGYARPVAVHARHDIPGAGKTYLVNRFAELHASWFPGGYVRVALEPGDPRDEQMLITELADKLSVRLQPNHTSLVGALRERLLRPRTLVHLEHADTPEGAAIAAAVARKLSHRAVVVSGRPPALTDDPWTLVEVGALEEKDALALLAKEHRAPRDEVEQHAHLRLVEALDGLPLSIHLAAAQLRAGMAPEDWLTRWGLEGAERPDLTDAERAANQMHAVLERLIQWSLSHLRQRLGPVAERQLAGLAALGRAPRSGVGPSLGAAIAGLSEVEYRSLLEQVGTLGLAESTREGAFRLHPRVAALLDGRVDQGEAMDRVAMWFIARLQELPPEQKAEQEKLWKEARAETEALVFWLRRVPANHWTVLAWPWNAYAQLNGPLGVWVQLCERLLPALEDDALRSQVLDTLATVACVAGDLARALAVAQQKLALDRGRADHAQAARAIRAIAHIKQLQGDHDEALRLLRDEALPVFAELQDGSSYYATLTDVADLLRLRGEGDEALRLYRNEALNWFEEAGDVRAKAAVQGKIAQELIRRGELEEAHQLLREQVIPTLHGTGDTRSTAVALALLAQVLYAQGKSDEALCLYQEEVRPAFDKTGDIQQSATILVHVAEILLAKGDPDEALRLLREEALPVFDTLGDVRGRTVALGKIAHILALRGDIDEAIRLWRYEQLPVWEKLHDVEERAQTLRAIADAQARRGELTEALHIYQQDVLPVLERAGAQLELAIAKGAMAHILLLQGELEEAKRIRSEEELPIYEQLGARQARSSALAEMASIHAAYGNFEQALQILSQDVIPQVVETGNARNIATVRAQQAQALVALGRSDEALQMCRNEALPLAKKAQDARTEATIQLTIADALRDREQIDEALDVCRKDVLPLLEKLGDARAQAITRAKIAKILSEGGEHAEALRILQEDVLPVLKRSGAAVEHATAISNLAAIHLRRGDIEEALRLTRDNALPALEKAKVVSSVIRTQHLLGRILLRRNHADDREQAYSVLRGALEQAKRAGAEAEEDAAAIRRTLQAPFLELIQIRNFKNLTSLDLSFRHDSELPGRWTCIAGINGVGKSAILQALILVLLGDRLAQEVGGEWLSRARSLIGGQPRDAEIRATIVNGSGTLEITLPIGEGGVDLDKLSADPKRYRAMRAFWDERARDHLLVAYGPGRNLSEHIDSRHSGKSDEVQRQMTLFDPLTQVAAAEALIEEERAGKSILPMLRRLLAVVLEGTPLSVAPDEGALRFRIGETRLKAVDLPDGFRATIAWLADLCAAWRRKAPLESRDGDPSRIRGLVIIDEIDLHLHPSLQRVLVPRLRKALPEVHWIVTTHSPLVLTSFDSRELLLLQTDAGGVTQLRAPLDRQILGFTIDEVYRWLLEIPPRSAALDDRFQQGGRDVDARLTLLLSQSPEVSEAEAEEDRAFRMALAKKIRERATREGASPEQAKP